MLRIGICDDQTSARDALRFQLEKLINEDSEQIVYEFSSGNSAAKWLRTHPGEIDLLFLDIEMEGLNGMETAKMIRTYDQELIIVFVTSYSDYVFDGYQVDALDYIMKPAELERLTNLLSRVRSLIFKQEAAVFVFKNTEGTFRIPLAKIHYFYSDKRKVFLVMEDKEYDFYDKLNDIEPELDDEFVRIHQRYLVNPKFVNHVGTASIMVGKAELPLSRSLKETATRKLALSMF